MRFRVADGRPTPIGPNEATDDTIDLDGAVVATGWSKDTLEAIWRLAWEGTAGSQDVVDNALDGWRNDPSKVLIRNASFSHLKEPDFALFLAMCLERKLSPWTGQVFAEFRWNQYRKSNDLAIIASINVRRAIAHETGKYAGCDSSEFIYGETKIPLQCSVSVYRIVDGVRCKFTGDAVMDDCKGSPGSLWDIKPHACIAICAEAAALRRAFPELAGIYDPLEFSRGPDNNGPKPLTDEEIPHTYMGLQRSLIEAGVEKLPDREALIRKFREEFPNLLENDERAFYEKVLAAAKRGMISAARTG